jgi:hypothetical protein
MECAFLRRIMLRCRVENARIAARPRGPFRARRRRYSGIHHAKKILRRRPSAGLLTARARRKTRKTRPNRFARRGVRGGARTRRGITAGEIFARATDREERSRTMFRDASAGISEACAVKFRSAS